MGSGGFELFQNGWLMMPDRLQYFWDDFWNFQKIGQIWTLGPRVYHQNIEKYKK